MRKSFTRLFSLVMLLGFVCFSGYAGAAVWDIPTTVLGTGVTKVLPEGATAYTKTTDKAMVIYSENVVASTGSIRVTNANGIVRVIPATDPRVSFAKGDTVVIDLSADLKELTMYAVSVDLDAFKAADGTPASYAGNSTTWGWQTGDYTGPTLKSVVPEKGTSLPTAASSVSLRMTFEDASPILKGTGNVALYKADGNVWDLISLTPTTAGVTLNSTGANTYELVIPAGRTLEDNVNYAVTIGAGVVTDNGQRADNIPSKPVLNAFAGLTDRTVWTFSTKDYTAPGYATGYPKIGTVTNTSAAILINTKEVGKAYAIINNSATALDPLTQIKNGAGVQSVTIATAGTEYSINFTSKTANTLYYIHVVTENTDGVLSSEVVKAVKTTELNGPVLDLVTYKKGTTYELDANMGATITSNPVDQKLDKIVLTFTDAQDTVKIGSGNVIIRKVVDNSDYIVVPSTSFKHPSDLVIEVPITKALENNASYYVIFPNTLISDPYNNKYAGITTTTGWKINSNDVIAPTFTLSPVEGSVNDVDVDVVIKFSEVVSAISGKSLTATFASGNSPFIIQQDGVNFNFVAPTVSDNGGLYTSVTFSHADFNSSAVISVIVDKDMITDGDNLIDTKQGISFLIKDVKGPVITWDTLPTTPTGKFVIKFNEGIYLLGGTKVTDDNLGDILTVKKTNSSGTNVSVNATIDAAGKVITIIPTAPWASQTTYYVAVSASIEDAAGNDYDAAYGGARTNTSLIADKSQQSVAFTVGGTALGTTAIDPASGILISFKDIEANAAQNVGSWIYGGTEHAYAAGSILADLQNVLVLKEGSASGPNVDINTAVVSTASSAFTITAALQSNKTYYFGIGASSKDVIATGNTNVAKYVTFTTNSTGDPLLESSTIVDDQKEVAVKADLVLTFDTDIVLAAQAVYDIAYDVAGDDPASTADNKQGIYFVKSDASKVYVTYANLEVSGKTLKIKHADFATDEMYDLVVLPGVVINKNSANDFGGLVFGDLHFATIDKKVTLIALSPDDVFGSTVAVEVNSKLEITAGEEVLPGTGYLTVRVKDTDALVERFAATSDKVVYSYNSVDDETTITITPSALLKYDYAYYVEVDNGFFVDKLGNKNVAIYGDSETDTKPLQAWTFTTLDPALAVIKVTPADGSDKVAVNANIVVEFNREIEAGTGSVGFIEFDGASTYVNEFYSVDGTNITISGKTLTIAHTSRVFTAERQVFIYLEGGAIVVKGDDTKENLNIDADATDGAVVGETATTYSFATDDRNAPKPTFSPVAFDEDEPAYVAVDTNISITFDENIYNIDNSPVGPLNVAADGGIFVLYNVTEAETVDFTASISGKVVTIVPSAVLKEASVYEIRIVDGMIEDAIGGGNHILNNPSGTFTASRFITVDKTAPVVTLDFAGGEELLSITNIETDDVNAKYFYYLVALKSTGLNPTASDVMTNGTRKSFDEGSVSTVTVEDLLADTDYEVFYVSSDSFGNVSDVTSEEFSTDDTVKPLFISSNPVNGTVNVDVVYDEDLEVNLFKVKLTFNEDVQLTEGNGPIYIKDKATDVILSTLDQDALLVNEDNTKEVELTVPFSITSDPVSLYIELGTGLLEDLAGNDFAGVYGPNAIYFTTEDNVRPTIARDGTGDIAISDNLKFKSAESVKAGTGKAVLYKGSVADANAIEVFDATGITFTDKTWSINPTANLAVNTNYYVTYTANFVLDLSSTKNGNVANTVGILFHTSAKAKPSVDVVDDLTTEVEDVDVNNDLPAKLNKQLLEKVIVRFSENVSLEIAGIKKSLLILSQSEIKAKMTLTDGNGVAVPYSISDKAANEFTVNIAAKDLKDMSSYTMTIGGFIDSDDMIMDNASFTWETTDGSAPVAIFNPADEDENVNPTSNLTITFDSQVYRSVATVNDEFFYQPIDNTNVSALVFLQEDGIDVPFTATFNGVDKITIDPSLPLESTLTYVYGLVPASTGVVAATIADKDGNVLTGGNDGTTATFVVADVDAPKLSEISVDNFAPLGAGTDADDDMWVKFTEPITVSTGSIVIRREDGTIFQTVTKTGLSIDADDDAILLIAHNNFEPLTNYFVEISASTVVDESGNPNILFNDPTSEKGWLFTTSDTYNLTATVTPTGDNTARSVNLELMFNKVPRGITNKFVAVYKEDGTAVKQVLASSLTPNGKVISIPVSLEANQAYYARVESGAFVDDVTPANKFAGIMDNSWVFSTVNNIAPQVVTLTPADNALKVDAQTSAFTIAFDRNVAVGTGVISVRYAVDGKVFEDVDVTKAVVNAKTLTFNISKVLDSNTAFYVLIPVGAITNTEVTKDSFAGILNTYTWNFTTSTDKTAPKLLTWTPNATTITDNHPTLVMTFDEAVVLGAGNVKIVKKSDNVTALTIPVTAAMVSDKTVTVTYSVVAPATGLDKNTDYYVLVDGGIVKDAAGNATAAVADVAAWTFKTGADFATVIPVINDSQFKVYPNPFVDYVTVTNASELTKVVVSNIAGQVVKEVVNPENTIQLNELRSGVYFISLYQENAVIKTAKIVKR